MPPDPEPIPYPGRWTHESDPDEVEIPPWPLGSCEVTEKENLVINVLYGPDGDILSELRERRTVPFGYQKWEGQ